jgi:hypothetical protein
MPKPEIYVIYTGERGNKPEVISLSEEFFGGTDVDIEVRAKVIYESDTHDIINQYIIFCKVFDEQRELYGLTEQAIRETVRICQDRDVLKEYLANKEKEVVTIMMNLFDEEQIRIIYAKDMAREAAEEAAKEAAKETAIETAERMIKKGKMSLDEIADCVPLLTMEELRGIEAEVMQLS